MYRYNNIDGSCSLVPHLAGEEDEYVSRRLRDVDLQHGDDARLEVVCLGRLGVHDIDGEAAAWDVEDGCVVEVLREPVATHGAPDQQCTAWEVHGVGVHTVRPWGELGRVERRARD